MHLHRHLQLLPVSHSGLFFVLLTGRSQPCCRQAYHSSALCRVQAAALPGRLDDHRPIFPSMDASRGSSAIFPMQQIPSLLYQPPPRPLPSSLSLSSSPSRHAPSITNFPILLLTVLGILATSVLLLAYYVFVIRCCLNWHSSSSSSGAAGLVSRRGRRRQRAGTSTSTTSSLPVSGGAPAEPRGLEEVAIQALPVFQYSRKKAVTDNTSPAPASECAVCLGEFEDEERVRMLPACLHVFHVACIDTWLHGNANCPLCRADIASHCLLPLPPLQESDQLRRAQEQEVVIQLVPGAEEADDAAQSQAQQRGAATASAESAGEGEATVAADHQVVGEKRKSVSAWHEIDISNKEDECVEESKDGDVLVLPLRRSFSMGTMGDEEVRLQIQKILQMNTRSHRDDHDSDSSSSSSSSTV